MKFFAGAFYFTLGNLPTKCRSKLNSIYVVALLKQKFVTLYGMDKILEPFIEDIIQLVSLTTIIYIILTS